MKCLILAAGRGRRLKPLTNKIPKPLIEVKGKSLIKYQIEALKTIGVEDFFVVIGYKGEMLKKNLKNKNITYIENADYDETTSLESSYLAKEYLSGNEFILINGDLIFDHKKIEALKDYFGKNATLAKSKNELEENEMNIISENGKIKKISKSLNPTECDSQSLQISLFSKQGSKIIFDYIPKKIKSGGKFPADAFEKVIEKDEMYKVEGSDKGFWFEIDDYNDLESARDEIK